MRRAVIVAVIHTSIHPDDDDDDDDDDGHRDECPIHRTNETHTYTHTHTHTPKRKRKKERKKSPSSSLTKKQTNNATNLRINRPSGICMSVVMVST